MEEILALRDQGKSNREIAERLGLSKGQVSGIIFRARSPRYREALRENSGERAEYQLRKLVKVHGKPLIAALLAKIAGN